MLNVGGAAVLVVTAIHLVRTAMDHQAETDERVRVLEGDVQVERTLLHEIAGTVAGISAASRLLSVATGLDRDERAGSELLLTETARMDRLLPRPVSGPPAIRRRRPRRAARAPAVRARDPRPRRRLAPNGRPRAGSGRTRDLVEVLDLLIDNAARHGRTPSLRSPSRGAATRWT